MVSTVLCQIQPYKQTYPSSQAPWAFAFVGCDLNSQGSDASDSLQCIINKLCTVEILTVMLQFPFISMVTFCYD